MIIYEDTRQQHCYSEYDIFKPYDMQRICLKTADYTTNAPDAILIEVKAAVDIIDCFGVSKARFNAEVTRGFNVLLLECTKDDIAIALAKRKKRYPKTKMTPQYIFACLKKLHTTYGISVLFAGSKEDAAKILHDLLVTDYKLKMINA